MSFDWEDGRKYRTRGGEVVRSKGERRIANHLNARGYEYEYEADICGYRPDFFLPNHNAVVEYWGWEGEEYQKRRQEKTEVYRNAGYLLIDLEAEEWDRLPQALDRKLSHQDIAPIPSPWWYRVPFLASGINLFLGGGSAALGLAFIGLIAFIWVKSRVPQPVPTQEDDDGPNAKTEAHSTDSSVDDSTEAGASQIYLGKGASLNGWITLPKEVIENEIVPIVEANLAEDDGAAIIQMNFGSEVSLSGWTKVRQDAVKSRIEPVVKEQKEDQS